LILPGGSFVKVPAAKFEADIVKRQHGRKGPNINRDWKGTLLSEPSRLAGKN